MVTGARTTSGLPEGPAAPQGLPDGLIPYTVGRMELQASKYDPSERRQSQRKQRERGVWVYIAAEELVKVGISPFAKPPRYRVWGRRGGSVLVRLYKEASE